MDTEDLTLEEKCEHVMKEVVESRKRFGQMCNDYEQKTSLVEEKMLELQVESIKNCRFKSKQQIPEINLESMDKDIENAHMGIFEYTRRLKELKNKIQNTQHAVSQLKQDQIGTKLKKPLTAEVLLASAKSKENI